MINHNKKKKCQDTVKAEAENENKNDRKIKRAKEIDEERENHSSDIHLILLVQ